MATFESGVTSYQRGRAVVEVYFPVDKNGNAFANCSQCFFYRDGSHRCSLNGEICAFPNKYVGDACPLMTDTEFLNWIKTIYDVEKETNNDSEV